jgi:hypothetical protein
MRFVKFIVDGKLYDLVGNIYIRAYIRTYTYTYTCDHIYVYRIQKGMKRMMSTILNTVIKYRKIMLLKKRFTKR